MVKSKLNKCKHCKSPTSNKKYCSRACQQQHTVKLNKQRALTNFKRTGFGKWLYWNVVRAGTVEIMKGHTTQSLDELFKLYKFMVRSNGYGTARKNLYVLAHLAPVKGSDTIGLLNTSNLMVTDRNLNASMKNDEYGHIETISQHLLSGEYTTYKGESPDGVYHKINTYLNGGLNSWVKLTQLKPTSTKSTEFKETPLGWTDVLYTEVSRLLRATSDPYLNFGLDLLVGELGIDLAEDDENKFGVTFEGYNQASKAILTNKVLSQY